MTGEDSKREIKALVVSNKFPVINQPWMDTYLEQLVKNNVKFSVFSLNLFPEIYQEKVDRLGFLNNTKAYSFGEMSVFRVIIKRFRPFASIRSFLKIRRKNILTNCSHRKLLSYVFHFHAISESYHNVTVIHSHSEATSYRFTVLAEILNVPLVLTFHGLPPSGVPQLDPEKRHELYRYARKVVVNTNFAKKQVLRFGCTPEKVEVLPQGLPIEDFPFDPAPVPTKGEPLRMLSVGRLHRDKGQHYSLLALRRLLDDGVQATWSFVGAGVNVAKLKALAHKLRIIEHVSFYENASSQKLRQLYSQSHIFVLASIDTPGGHVETQGVVLQEAQASGCLVIATDVGGIPECLNHESDALLVKQQSSRSIFSAIEYFYSNPEKWPSFREEGLRNVKENFSASVIGKRMASVLSQVSESE